MVKADTTRMRERRINHHAFGPETSVTAERQRESRSSMGREGGEFAEGGAHEGRRERERRRIHTRAVRVVALIRVRGQLERSRVGVREGLCVRAALSLWYDN